MSVDVKQNGHKPPSKSTSQVYEESVKSAWGEGEGDMELGTSEVGIDDRKAVEEVEEEESRYGIADQPPKKRRRSGTKKDLHTVYVSDDEDEDGGPSPLYVGENDGVSEEEEEYDVGGGDGDFSSNKRAKAKKRSYWLSKGVGPED